MSKAALLPNHHTENPGRQTMAHPGCQGDQFFWAVRYLARCISEGSWQT